MMSQDDMRDGHRRGEKGEEAFVKDVNGRIGPQRMIHGGVRKGGDAVERGPAAGGRNDVVVERKRSK